MENIFVGIIISLLIIITIGCIIFGGITMYQMVQSIKIKKDE